MTVFILVIMILPLNIISFIIMNTVLENAKDSVISSISTNLASYMEDLDNRLNSSYYYLYEISSGDYCRKYYSNSEGSRTHWTFVYDRYQLYREISEMPFLNDYADGFYFSRPDIDDFLFVDLNNSDFINQENSSDLIRSLSIPDQKWHLYSDQEYAYMIRNMIQNDFSYGVIVNCENNLPAFDYDNYELLFSTTVPEKAYDLISCSQKSGVSDCILHFVWPYSELTGNINLWVYFMFLCVFIYLLAIPTLYHIFKKHVGKPLNELNHAHHELLIGNEDYLIETASNTLEFAKAYDGFNNMAKTLKDLRLEKINRELAYKEMQLNNLQLQIRPHFLLNMMNLLYTLVQNHETTGAQEMILYLSQYFRYMFRNGKDLNLFAKELDLIRNYLSVSRLQHPGAFTVSYQIDPVIDLMRIPPLLIHNFVENIIHHALLPDRVVHIVLFGEYEDHMVTLQISDDGRGMPGEDVEMINNRTFPDGNSGKHIGIRNSITRLHYYFGEQAQVTVESCPGMGTTFSIYIPYDLEEETNDETFDRK